MYQIIIKNGIVIDPANRFHGQADVAVAEGKIAGIGQYSNDAVMVVDASGCIVTPGLIDHHAHLYPLAKIGIPAEAMCFSSGVTTAVDAGSTGCDTFSANILEQVDHPGVSQCLFYRVGLAAARDGGC